MKYSRKGMMKTLKEKERTSSSSSNLKGIRADEDLLENRYEEIITKAMTEKDQCIYQGELEPGYSREIKVELKKTMYITRPVRSKDRNDVEEETKKLVKHIEENLKYNVHRIGHISAMG